MAPQKGSRGIMHGDVIFLPQEYIYVILECFFRTCTCLDNNSKQCLPFDGPLLIAQSLQYHTSSCDLGWVGHL